ncbi:MAG: cadherin repeat domain-containing protein, partial [Ekhidna sp.]|nr:cadherin repeat domain-containing protein [Ekhidna sp.]
GTVAASDADGNALTFTITAGNTIGDGGEVFALNETTGALTVKTAAPLDYETVANRTFTLTVRVSDGTLSETADFIVNVTNVNDNAPTIVAQTFSVAESAAVGTVVGTVAASDADGNALTFTITAGNTIGDGGEVFALNETTGALTVKTAAPLDYETVANRTFTLTVRVSDGTLSETADFIVNVTDVARGAHLSARDINTLKDAGNNNPVGLWSDGITLWVLEATTSEDKVYAYTLADGTRNTGKDINTLEDAGNNHPAGLWSDGTTLWVSDIIDDKVYAYTLADGARDTAKDIKADTLKAAGNEIPYGLWSDGTTLWVSDFSDGKVYAYTLATGARNTGKEFDLADDNDEPFSLWSDGTTLWVSENSTDKVYAYTLADGTRNTGKDINILNDRTKNSVGLWSDGITLWVGDNVGDKIYAYFLDN